MQERILAWLDGQRHDCEAEAATAALLAVRGEADDLESHARKAREHYAASEAFREAYDFVAKLHYDR